MFDLEFVVNFASAIQRHLYSFFKLLLSFVNFRRAAMAPYMTTYLVTNAAEVVT
jgi:hypothetical protein